MKKIIYIASFLCAALLAGCDDFLTTESPDFSTDKYWRDKADVEAGLSGYMASWITAPALTRLQKSSLLWKPSVAMRW